MNRTQRRLLSVAIAVMVVAPLLITIYLLFLSPHDLSARQTGKQRTFGATYMTMNNPYFQMLDAQIQGHLELRGDVLLTRDAAMDQQRQNQEIQELVDAGVCAIGYDRLLENTTGVVQFGFVKTGELQAQALLVD